MISLQWQIKTSKMFYVGPTATVKLFLLILAEFLVVSYDDGCRSFSTCLGYLVEDVVKGKVFWEVLINRSEKFIANNNNTDNIDFNGIKYFVAASFCHL